MKGWTRQKTYMSWKGMDEEGSRLKAEGLIVAYISTYAHGLYTLWVR